MRANSMKKLACVVVVAAAVAASAAAAPAAQLRAAAERLRGSGAADAVQRELRSVDELLKQSGGATAERVAQLQAEEEASRMRFARARVELSSDKPAAAAKAAPAAAAETGKQMRFAHAAARAGARAGAGAGAAGFPDGVYQFGSVLGNGVQDLRSPQYGSFAGRFGPMSIAGEPFAHGSLTNALDPRGFGMQLANYSQPWAYGVHPMWPVPPSPYPLKVDAPFNPYMSTPPYSGVMATTAQGGPVMTPWGFAPKMPDVNYTTFMGPRPFGPYGVTAHPFTGGMPGQWASRPPVFGLNPGFGMPQHGAIPSTRPGQPGGGMPGFLPGNNPFFGTALPAFGAFPGFGVAPGALAGYPAVGAAGLSPQMAGMQPNPSNGFVPPPLYMAPQSLVPSPYMGSHPGFALTGMGVNYPHPDFDRYHSVLTAPPTPVGASAAEGF